MATWTGTETVDFVRALIDEKYAKSWSPAVLLLFINAALRKVSSEIIALGAEYFFTSAVITANGSQYYALPNGTLYSSAKKCCGKVFFAVNSTTDREISRGDFRDYHVGYSACEDPLDYDIMGDYIWFKSPVSTGTSITLYYYYVPTAITNDSTNIDFIEGIESWLAYDAAIMALVAKQVDVSDFMTIRNEVRASFVTGCTPRIVGRPAYAGSDSGYENE